MKVGDVVYLRSGSPPLTVVALRPSPAMFDRVECMWVVNGAAQHATFPEEALTQIDPAELLRATVRQLRSEFLDEGEGHG
jgi:uncharacterized protein YodC (DUF2158 family)